MRPNTQRRVERAIKDMDFVPNGVARGLMSSKSGTIGLIIPDIANPFFGMVARGAETVARQAGYRVLLCNSEGDLSLERQYVEDMISHRVEGLLIAPVSDWSKDNLTPLVRRGFPFVLIDRSVAGMTCDLVQADSVEAARLLMTHLIAVGHKSIACIVESDGVSTARDRLLGCQKAMKAAKIKLPAQAIIRTTADRAGGYEAARKILALPLRPTAIFAVNNMTATGAMHALREAGVSVPEDMALVCFDDVEHLTAPSPFMTVVDQPAEAFGRLSAELMLERLSGASERVPRRVVLKAELRVRESCGAKVAHGARDKEADVATKRSLPQTQVSRRVEPARQASGG